MLKWMMLKYITLALLASCVIVGGCKSGDAAADTSTPATTATKAPGTDAAKSDAAGANKLAGTWEGSDKATYVFNDDGTFVQTQDMNGKGEATVKGTYKLDGDKLDITFTSFEAKAKDPKEQADYDKLAAGAKEKMKGETDPIVFKSNDEIELEQKQGTGTNKVTLKRKAA